MSSGLAPSFHCLTTLGGVVAGSIRQTVPSPLHATQTEPKPIAIGFGSVWVACKGDGTVWRIDPATTPPKVVKQWKLGASPEDIAAGAGAVWTAVYSKLES